MLVDGDGGEAIEGEAPLLCSGEVGDIGGEQLVSLERKFAAGKKYYVRAYAEGIGGKGPLSEETILVDNTAPDRAPVLRLVKALRDALDQFEQDEQSRSGQE